MQADLTVTVDGVRSPVLQAGPADASEAVVFVHGNPGPAIDYADLVERVGGFARAIAPDMPGYGGADKPADFDYTVDGYARHLAGILDELGIGRAHLVLHDFGGSWGLTWATNHSNAWVRSARLIARHWCCGEPRTSTSRSSRRIGSVSRSRQRGSNYSTASAIGRSSKTRTGWPRWSCRFSVSRSPRSAPDLVVGRTIV